MNLMEEMDMMEKGCRYLKIEYDYDNFEVTSLLVKTCLEDKYPDFTFNVESIEAELSMIKDNLEDSLKEINKIEC